MKQHKYTIERVFEDLKRKKVKITFNGLVYIMDISSAESLGNKSWGKIEYLVKIHKMQLIGRNTYLHANDAQKES